MDIHCRHCGAPTEHETLHDQSVPYKEAGERFAKYGCGSLWTTTPVRCNREEIDIDRDKAVYAQAMQELSPHPGDWNMDFI